jgi:hypothetical protein
MPDRYDLAGAVVIIGAPRRETVWKFYSAGHLMAFSALPVLTDSNVRCARRSRDPETTTI